MLNSRNTPLFYYNLHYKIFFVKFSKYPEISHGCSWAGINKPSSRWRNLKSIAKDVMVSYDRKVYVVWLVRATSEVSIQAFHGFDGCSLTENNKDSSIYIVWLVRGLLLSWVDCCGFEPPPNYVYTHFVALMDVHWPRTKKTSLYI